jgi:hypothetical protein
MKIASTAVDMLQTSRKWSLLLFLKHLHHIFLSAKKLLAIYEIKKPYHVVKLFAYLLFLKFWA